MAHPTNVIASSGMGNAHFQEVAPVDKRPDHMGVWDDGGDIIWLPRSIYPKRIDAIRWAMGEWSCSLPDVRCLSRWMVYAPEVHGPFDLDGFTDPGWTDDLWRECEKDEANAFQVWRLESA